MFILYLIVLGHTSIILNKTLHAQHPHISKIIRHILIVTPHIKLQPILILSSLDHWKALALEAPQLASQPYSLSDCVEVLNMKGQGERSVDWMRVWAWRNWLGLAEVDVGVVLDWKVFAHTLVMFKYILLDANYKGYL